MSWEGTRLNLVGDQEPISLSNDLIKMNPGISLYPRIFAFIKAQKTIVCNIIESIASSEGSKDCVSTVFKNLLLKILAANYSELFQVTDSAIEEIVNILKEDLPKDVDILGYRIIKTLTAVLRIRSLLSVSISVDRQANPLRGQLAKAKVDYDECSLCRICENYIPIEMIEKHAIACAAARESQKIVESLDDKVTKLIINAKNTILKMKWPNKSNVAQGLILPILHCCVLLERLLEINTDSGDSLSRVSVIYEGLEALQITSPGNEIAKDILARAYEYCRMKLKACKTLDSLISQQGCRPVSVSISDFRFLKHISRGAYARVFLARKESSGDHYAIKVISRAKAAQKNTAFTEKDILGNFNSDYVVKLFYSLTGINNLYLVMEYLPGGDLKNVLEHVGCFSEDFTRIYIAQIVAALDDLRRAGIVHRDVKPDNVLIDANGHLKLADFGLSFSGIVERNMFFVGTPDYVAPEIVLNRGHSFPADYWSLGVMIYELLTGVPPFHGDTPEETFMNICEAHIGPIEASDDAINLIGSLLKPNPLERLGCNGVGEIMSHPFFKTINWDRIDDIEPPFVPDLTSEDDTSYFGQCSLRDFADIQSDVETSRKRSFSFGPEFLKDALLSDNADDDFSLFPLISTSTLVDSTMKHAKKKKPRSVSFNTEIDVSSTSLPTILSTPPAQLKRRQFQSRTPKPSSPRIQSRLLPATAKENPI